MSKEKDMELETILTEINSGIKKSKVSNENKADKNAKKSDNTLKSQSQNEENKKPSFIETARIIEKEPESIDILFDRKSKHIQVTAEEILDTDEKKSDENQSDVKNVQKKVSKSNLKKLNGTAVTRQHEQKNTPSKKQKKIALFGVLITFFVIIGVGSTIWSTVKFTNKIVNNTSLKEELAREIFPLVIVDVPEFQDPTKLDNSAIIASSIWKFIIDQEDKSKYKKDDLGSIYVPDVDIEKHIRRIYGGDVKIEHQSVDDSSVQMTYDPESKYYVIESTPKFLPYTPRVDKILKTGNILTLRVSYILPDAMWNLKSDKKNQIVDKVMEYKLKKNGKNYQMISVKLLEVTSRAEINAGQNDDVLSEEVPIEDIAPSSEAKEAPAKSAQTSSKANSVKK